MRTAERARQKRVWWQAWGPYWKRQLANVPSTIRSMVYWVGGISLTFAFLAAPAAIIGIFFPDFAVLHPILSGLIAFTSVAVMAIVTWGR